MRVRSNHGASVKQPDHQAVRIRKWCLAHYWSTNSKKKMSHLRLLILAFILSAGLPVFAQKGKPADKKPRQNPIPEVPALLKSKFTIAYPDAVVNGWQTEGEYYKVLFSDKNVQQVVVYDTSGNVIRKETELDGAVVPQGISEYYKQKYPGKKDIKVWQSEDAGGRKSYNTLHKGEVLYFDSEGKFLRGEKRPPVQIRRDGEPEPSGQGTRTKPATPRK
jgi:hypothetical protein